MDNNYCIPRTEESAKEFTIFDALLDSMIQKEEKESTFSRFLKHIHSPWNVASLSLIVVGLTTLTWVGEIIWTDITFYGKDITTTLLNSRGR